MINSLLKKLLTVLFMPNMAFAYYSYSVVDLYKEIEIDEPIGEDSYGEVIELSQVYQKVNLPASMEGKHMISVTRAGDDFYKIDGTSLIIKTYLCHEVAVHEDVVLVIDNRFGFYKGEIHFPD